MILPLKHLRTIAISLCLLCMIPSQAQRNRTKDGPQSTAPSATELMRDYRWSEARMVLERELSNLKRAKKPTETVEADLRFIEKAEAMMPGTERVAFVDSLIVGRDNFFAAFPLSVECGKIGYLGQLMRRMDMNDPMSQVVAYRNQLADCIYLSLPDSTGCHKIGRTEYIAQKWTTPAPLPGLSETEGTQAYPFVMQDGMTLYFAAQNPDGLGGYDIYVTRYNAESKEYVHPENIGMPFNSPANDYMYVVDEVNGIGWFVTDRRMPADSVCIYFFLPSDARQAYAIDTEDPASVERLRRAAMIHSISESKVDPSQADLARRRIHGQLATGTRPSENETAPVCFVISDTRTYTSLDEFQSETARRIARTWLERKADLEGMERLLDAGRRDYRQPSGNRPDANALRSLEEECRALRSEVLQLEKNMRQAENQTKK